MGYLQDADTIVRQTSNELDKILNSKSAIFLQGLGDPVLVNWWNMNDSLSTADSGMGTVDSIIGKDSPFRYNKIEGLPAYGIARDLRNIEMSLDDNGIMDMNIELEPILLPNTIIPGPFDYMEYCFGNGRNVFFRINDVKVTSIKSNGFYKVPMHIVDIDSSDYPNGIEEITVKTMKVKLDNVGTNEKCIISDKVFDDINNIEKFIPRVLSDYIDTFFVRKYNSFILRGFDNMYNIYDPYLTNFIINQNLMSYYDEILQPVVMEQDTQFRSEYNKTVFRAVELRDCKFINKLLYNLNTFSRHCTDPFSYWGEEMVYVMKTYIDNEHKFPNNKYMNFEYLYNIPNIKESSSITMMENLIIRYFKNGDFIKFTNNDELLLLDKVMNIEYNEYYFYMTPVIIYIIDGYKKYLINNYS